MGGDYTRVTFDALKAFSGVHKQQGRVSLDSEFNEFEQILDRRDRAEMYDTVGRTFVPATTPDAFLIDVGGAWQLTIGIGRAYVDGILAECFGDMSNAAATVPDDNLGGLHGPVPVDYDKQPFFYQPAYPALSATPGTIDLVYLDVWQREVTVLEDAALREIALNGPDTATRVQTAWQVKILQKVPSTSCATPPPEWTALTAPSTARITAAATPAAPAPGPCVINPAGGYTGLENRLYRIEIHKAGTLDGAGKAQFKWSRDNASLGARVVAINPAGVGQSTIVVSSTGRDAWTRFDHGDHLELLDDDVEWAMRESGNGGPMASVISVNHATGEILIDRDLLAFTVTAARHPRIRKWDFATAAEPLVRDVNNGTAIPLEEGISVTFGSAATDTLHAGDYIVFATRTADGTIDLVDNQLPLGIPHHFMQLALVAAGSPPTVATDCRVPPTTTTPTQEGCCTVVVKPGEDIQAALDSLPPSGGCVCLKVGDHVIGAPIFIRKSNVALHGESIGARVLGHEILRLLVIGDFTGAGVSDVMVHDIRFETRGGAVDPNDPDHDAVINIMVSQRVAVHDCDIRVAKSFPMAGIAVTRSRDVRVERTGIELPQVGIRTLDECERVIVRDNLLEGGNADLDFGLVAVLMLKVRGACDVSGNHIIGFAEGIRLTQMTGPGGGSLIQRNVVERRRPPDSPVATVLWGIDAGGAGATIRDNAVAIAVERHAGIRATGTGLDIDNNSVVSSVQGSRPSMGILLDGPIVPASEADGTIASNRLRGFLIGIEVRGCRGAEVIANDIRIGRQRDNTTGILVIQSRAVLVASNVIVGADAGIGVVAGTEVRVSGNQLDSGRTGIMAVRSTAVTIADNVIDTMDESGIAASGIIQTTTISRNRLVRCCSRHEQIAAIAAGQGPDEVVVEFNDVLDTGIAPSGAPVGPVDGIHLLQCARSRVQGNHVHYTKPEALNRNLESRALRLVGEKAATGLNHTTNNWALVQDNSFAGVGLTTLVEISGQVLLERVTFAQNYCEHYNIVNDHASTVSMLAVLMIVQGNHTKADPKIASFDFHNHGQATFLGNVGFDIRPPALVVPSPVGNFNIIVP